MSDQIIIVGAGPIGLWTAIQLKLQRPELEIIIKEKRSEYNRPHPLWLSPQAFADCLKDEQGIITKLIQQLQRNPHISTNKLQKTLADLALSLGVAIDHNQEVQDLKQDILASHPDVDVIIGADSIHSTMHNLIFGDENTDKMPLAYAAQIKYQTQGPCLPDSNILDMYSLIKQSHYLVSVNHGKFDEQNNTTNVTIQFLIDKPLYEALNGGQPRNAPISLFTEALPDCVPAKLLHDIKTQMGYRLVNQENILLNTVKLTTTELPQQRRHRTTIYQNGRYYALIGDAALGLSFFRGMNSGLQLANYFAKTIAAQWPAIKRHDQNALADYDAYYDRFADHAVYKGYQTNYLLTFFRSCLNFTAMSPVQSVYVGSNDIATLHNHFDIMQQGGQFCMAVQESHSATEIQTWLKTQMPAGLVILRNQLPIEAEVYREDHPLLHSALLVLADIDPTQLSFHDQAYLGLAINKTRKLLENPTREEHQAYLTFLAQLKPANSSFSHIVSVSLLLIAGVVGISLGLGAMLGLVGLGLPISLACSVAGIVLFGLGQYHYHTKPRQMPSQTCLAVENIAETMRPVLG